MTSPTSMLRRAEFPALRTRTFLNAAGASPVCRRAAAEAQRYYDEMTSSADLSWEAWLQQCEDVRRAAASVMGAEPAEVAFASSTSHAFTLVAQLLGESSHVVAMRDEYPSATLPFLNVGDAVTFVDSEEDGRISIDAIASVIQPATRAVVTSSVMYRTGFRQDLGALAVMCREHGVHLVVDASQSLGVYPLDFRGLGVSAVAACGYKWLAAGYGIALLAVRGDLLQNGSPVAGWFSAREPDAFVNDRLDLKTSAAVLEVGSPSFPTIFALGGALQVLADYGHAGITGRVEALTTHLHAALDHAGLEVASTRDPRHRSGITIVRVDNPQNVVQELASAGIVVAARGAGLRVSPHAFNDEQDVSRLVQALVAMGQGQPLRAQASEQGPLVCVDLNGVLDAYTGWRGAQHWDAPAEGAAMFLSELRANGCRVVVFTTRYYRDAWDWLARHGLSEFVTDVTDRKPAADVFLDDRGLPFRGDFDAALRDMASFRPHWER